MRLGLTDEIMIAKVKVKGNQFLEDDKCLISRHPVFWAVV